MMTFDNSSGLLKLDFNERCDKVNPVTEFYPGGNKLCLYPKRHPLEQQIAQMYNLNPSQVLCTNGGDEAIMLLMRIIKETSRLILPLPAFSQYIEGGKSWSIKTRFVKPLKDFSIDMKSMLAITRETKNSVSIVTRPNNPTGELVPLAQLIELIEVANENNSWVFLDEAYIEFSQQKMDTSLLLEKFENLVIMRTLSKAYGLAGIRLGYLLGAERLVEKFRQRCLPFNIPQLSLDIASKVLTQTGRLDLTDYCQIINENKVELNNWFSSIGLKPTASEANFVFFELPNGQAKAVCSFLSKNNIAIRSFESSELSNCVRITIPSQLDKLMPLLKQCLQPELICMDMDGVLVNVSESYDLCVIKTVEQLSGKSIDNESMERLRSQGGFNNEWILSQRLLSELGFEISLDRVTEVFQQIYLGESQNGLCQFESPIIKERFKRLIGNVKKCEFAIVTGRPKEEAITGQNLIGLTQLECISLNDVEQPKPSPEGINKLQQKYSSLSWMCGDNVDDMQVAVASNSLAVGIGTTNRDSLYSAGADIVLDNINQLEKWLCRIEI